MGTPRADTTFAVRVACIDFEMCPPMSEMDVCYSSFRNEEIRAVPVVRIFGSTPAGQKCLVHLHRAFPYLFVQYPVDLPLEWDKVDSFSRQLAVSVDEAMSISSLSRLATNQQDAVLPPRGDVKAQPPAGTAAVPQMRGGGRRHVFKVEVVRGRPFYGFVGCERVFLKVMLYDPRSVSRVAALLRSGAVMGVSFQPYEAHLPFTLQVFVDNNLHGMAFASFSKVSFRSVPEHVAPAVRAQLDSLPRSVLDAGPEVRYRTWVQSNTQPELVSGLHRVSTCEVEVDASVDDLLNFSDLLQDSSQVAGDKKLLHTLSVMFQEAQKTGEQPEGPPQVPGDSQAPRALQPPSKYQRELLDRVEEMAKRDSPDANCGDLLEATQHSASPIFGSLQPSNAKYQAGKDDSSAHGHKRADHGVRREHEEQAKVDTAKVAELDTQDQELAEVLSWMRDQPLELSDAERDEAEEEERSSQREAVDIIQSSQWVGDGGPDHSPEDNIEDDGGLPRTSQVDGPVDDLPSKRKQQQKTYCSLFPEEDKQAKETLRKWHHTHSHRHHHHHHPTHEHGHHRQDRQQPRGCQDHDEQKERDCPSKEVVIPETPSPVIKAKQQRRVMFSPTIVPETPLPPRRAPAPDPAPPQVLLPVPVSDHRQDDEQRQDALVEDVAPAPAEPLPEPSPQVPPLAKFLAPAPAVKRVFVSSSPLSIDEQEEDGKGMQRDVGDEGARSRTYKPRMPPPSAQQIAGSMKDHGISSAVYRGASYGEPQDDPASRKQLGRSEPPCFDPMDIESLVDGGSSGRSGKPAAPCPRRVNKRMRRLVPVLPPPSREEVTMSWQSAKRGGAGEDEAESEMRCDEDFRVFQISWASEVTRKQKEYQTSAAQMLESCRASHPVSASSSRGPSSWHLNQHLTVMAVEVHVNTRGTLTPNPQFDSVQAICVAVRDDDLVETMGSEYCDSVATLCVCPDGTEADLLRRSRVSVQPDEGSLFRAFAQLVTSIDPDIMCGWEVQSLSLGYLVTRATKIGIDLSAAISRVKPSPLKGTKGPIAGLPGAAPGARGVNAADDWTTNGSSSSCVNIVGRIVLNVWRIMRSEVRVPTYSFESIVNAVLGLQVPRHTFAELTAWFKDPVRGRPQCLTYVSRRAGACLLLLDSLNVIGRTSEMARVLGIDFFSVLTRGSQYRVESMIFRLAKPHNYILVSPSKQQVARQPAPECIPLVMEPESRFYPSPVVVMDFQSLYPSIIIAYNYCYTTCLGRVDGFGSTKPPPAGQAATAAPMSRALGCVGMPELPKGLLGSLFREKSLVISPNGVLFVTPKVRQGILPTMLREVLDTRIAVKGALKRVKAGKDKECNSSLEKLLDSRQLSLKMVANVTYGYTAASLSGRMPCVDVADAIVETGRQTLESAIQMVESTPEWRAKVVYSDTDSMFVHLPGRTMDEACQIGKAIAARVTAANPEPVRLQFEKVYQPCVLVSKKRYVGYKHESPTSPVELDAKGIETVRRDGCPAVQKIVDQSLRIFFDTKDLSRVKRYLEEQWEAIDGLAVSPHDFIFSKEVRMGTYRGANVPPAAQVCLERMKADPCAEPKYGERVSYLVVCGGPGSRLSDLVVSPEKLLATPSLRLNSNYYIAKQIIPPLDRIFSLAGADVKAWYAALCRSRKRLQSRLAVLPSAPPKKSSRRTSTVMTIDQFYASANCVVCGDVIAPPNSGTVCPECSSLPAASCFVLQKRLSSLEQRLCLIRQSCLSCSFCPPSSFSPPPRPPSCVECPLSYERAQLERVLSSISRNTQT